MDNLITPIGVRWPKLHRRSYFDKVVECMPEEWLWKIGPFFISGIREKLQMSMNEPKSFVIEIERC